jgi:hypothetical protein
MAEPEDFSAVTKQTTADRAGNRCSNPSCRKPTSGPHADPTKAMRIGVAAHITAAAPGGPRYDPNLSSAARKSTHNAIWLCQTCSVLVESDAQTYTAEILQRWKTAAEDAAQKAFGATLPGSELSADREEPPQPYGSYEDQTKRLVHVYREARRELGIEEIVKQRDKLTDHVHEMELEKQRLESTCRGLVSQQERARRQSVLVWILSLFAILLMSMGVNYVTGGKQAEQTPGWVMIGVAGFLQALNFWIAYRSQD